MLCLNDNDIRRAASLEEILDSVEQAMLLYEAGDFHMPERMHVDHDGGTLLLMPCFSDNRSATKLVSVYPENANVKKPVIYGTVVLNDGKTGEPLAILNGSTLTALRTGAVGGVSIRHMAGNDCGSAGVVGAGIQGFHQLLFACETREIKDVYLFDITRDKAFAAAEGLEKCLSGVNVHTAESVEALLDASDIVITATTSGQPVLPEDPNLLKGKHYVAVGSYKPDMRELPGALFDLVDRVYVDTAHAAEEAGDLVVPVQQGRLSPDRITTLGKLISGQVKVDAEAENTSLFKSVGMALFDLVTSNLIFRKAREKGLGTEIDM